MKRKRHAKILEIINEYEIDTQEELQDRLKMAGYEVTQATISRDIKELRLVKELAHDGKYKYSTGRAAQTDFKMRLNGVFSESIISVNYAGNMVAVKCYSGMANAACAAIDNMHWEGVVGTLAGDDTFFVLCKNEDYAVVFSSDLERMINAKKS